MAGHDLVCRGLKTVRNASIVKKLGLIKQQLSIGGHYGTVSL
jgi:hypothetical protein